MDRLPAVYMLCNKPYGTLYVGVTSNLEKRTWEHRNGVVAGFTRQYDIHNLVWYELHATMMDAIGREKQLKHWKREWKIELSCRRTRCGEICTTSSKEWILASARMTPVWAGAMDPRIRKDDA